MARPTRSQRRARRLEQQRTSAASGNGSFAQRTARVRQVQPARQAPTQRGARRRLPLVGGLIDFSGESVGELKKVEWPNRPQVIQATMVVILACAIVGTYLFGLDALWKYIVHHWLLR